MTGLDALKELVDSGGYVAEDVYRFYDGLNHMIEYNMTQETVQIFMGNRCTIYGLTDRKKLTFSENSQGKAYSDSEIKTMLTALKAYSIDRDKLSVEDRSKYQYNVIHLYTAFMLMLSTGMHIRSRSDRLAMYLPFILAV